mmetsp:Transcript_50059/g.150637  ORF Transcript_50059/g.150637 Transcript_50059/m.150637 type:complete len:290 (+) Transcript_50059:563-1432(+)
MRPSCATLAHRHIHAPRPTPCQQRGPPCPRLSTGGATCSGPSTVLEAAAKYSFDVRRRPPKPRRKRGVAAQKVATETERGQSWVHPLRSPHSCQAREPSASLYGPSDHRGEGRVPLRRPHSRLCLWRGQGQPFALSGDRPCQHAAGSREADCRLWPSPRRTSSAGPSCPRASGPPPILGPPNLPQSFAAAARPDIVRIWVRPTTEAVVAAAGNPRSFVSLSGAASQPPPPNRIRPNRGRNLSVSSSPPQTLGSVGRRRRPRRRRRTGSPWRSRGTRAAATADGIFPPRP